MPKRKRRRHWSVGDKVNFVREMKQAEKAGMRKSEICRKWDVAVSQGLKWEREYDDGVSKLKEEGIKKLPQPEIKQDIEVVKTKDINNDSVSDIYNDRIMDNVVRIGNALTLTLENRNKILEQENRDLKRLLAERLISEQLKQLQEQRGEIA